MRIIDFLKQYPECIIKPSYGSAGVVGVQTIRKISEYHDYYKEKTFYYQTLINSCYNKKLKSNKNNIVMWPLIKINIG